MYLKCVKNKLIFIKKESRKKTKTKNIHLVASLVNISGGVIVHSEHRDQAIRIAICLKIIK